jgi:hypothetical protein
MRVKEAGVTFLGVIVQPACFAPEILSYTAQLVGFSLETLRGGRLGSGISLVIAPELLATLVPEHHT